MVRLMSNTFFKEKETKKKLVDFISQANILSMNKNCIKFEKDFSIFHDRKFSTLVNSGSSANLVLLQALLNLGRLKKGDKIAFTALTWATNVMPIIQLGLIPVPVDIELSTLSNNLELFTKTVNKEEIKAFFITNVLGFSSDIEAISSYCNEKEILLLEDNCESLGSEYNGKKLGNFSLASTVSFFVGHHLSAIEGGMICTDDFDLNQMLIIVRAHGWDRNVSKIKQEELKKKFSIDAFYDKYTFYDLGFNLRPTDITGFLGHTQLPFLDNIINRRFNNYKIFNKVALTNSDFLKLNIKGMNIVSNFAYPIICKDKKTFEFYKQLFQKNNIEIRPIIGGSIINQPFFKKYVKTKYDCPNASLVHQNGFYIPNRPDLKSEEINLIVNLLNNERS
jgi:CDP-4-dehydro-6-deoxyglucose reductase, E1